MRKFILSLIIALTIAFIPVTTHAYIEYEECPTIIFFPTTSLNDWIMQEMAYNTWVYKADCIATVHYRGEGWAIVNDRAIVLTKENSPMHGNQWIFCKRIILDWENPEKSLEPWGKIRKIGVDTWEYNEGKPIAIEYQEGFLITNAKGEKLDPGGNFIEKYVKIKRLSR